LILLLLINYVDFEYFCFNEPDNILIVKNKFFVLLIIILITLDGSTHSDEALYHTYNLILKSSNRESP